MLDNVVALGEGTAAATAFAVRGGFDLLLRGMQHMDGCDVSMGWMQTSKHADDDLRMCMLACFHVEMIERGMQAAQTSLILHAADLPLQTWLDQYLVMRIAHS